MKIKALVSFAGVDFSASKGQVIDLPDAVAEDMIRAGYAAKEGPAEASEPEVKTDEVKRADDSGHRRTAARKSKRAE